MELKPFGGFDKKIEAIFFDAGNTLITPQVSAVECYQGVLEKFGHDVSADDIRAIMPEVDQIYVNCVDEDDTFWASSERCRDVWYKMYEHLTNRLGFHNQAPEIAREYYKTLDMPNIWRTFDDVIPALNQFKVAGLKLAVISNWDIGLDKLLGPLGVLNYVDKLFPSAEIGLCKPYPEIYEYACKQMDVDFEHALMVGDNINADCFGSRSCNMNAALVHHLGGSIGVTGTNRDLIDRCPDGAQVFASGEEEGIVYISSLMQLVPFVC